MHNRCCCCVIDFPISSMEGGRGQLEQTGRMPKVFRVRVPAGRCNPRFTHHTTHALIVVEVPGVFQDDDDDAHLLIAFYYDSSERDPKVLGAIGTQTLID